MAAYETPSFNLSLLGLSMLLLLLFVLRRFFQRREIRQFNDSDRSAIRAAFYASFAHVATIVLGAVVISAVSDSLMSGFPTIFKVWLVLPIIAFIASLYLAYKTYGVWSNGLLAGVWARIRFSFVTLAALFMAWFYWYWNILGFQYL